ncbi:MAG: CooT family nickel-binding protein [Eubacteriales bacterium]
MCASNVYMIEKNGNEKLVLESVDKIIPTGDNIYLENIFFETKNIKARIKELALVDHKILLEEI